MKPNISKLTCILSLLCAVSKLQAQPVMTYTISGGSGNYTLDFTVNNTTPGTEGFDIYFWGVYDPNGTVSGIPTGFQFLNWSPYSLDGSGSPTPLNYNIGWIESVYQSGQLATGTTRSDFDVLDTSLTAPTSLNYFAYGIDNGVDYTGPDNLTLPTSSYYPWNPLFEGSALAQTVPEPSTLGLVAVGFIALVPRIRRTRIAA
jgi:PEP-CTERM motif